MISSLNSEAAAASTRLAPPPALPPALIAAQALVCERDSRGLFAPVDFALAAGDMLELLGANGSGKSSLLRALAGLSPDYRGVISVRGMPLDSARTELAAELLFLSHRSGLNAQLAAEENLHWLERLCAGSGATAAQVEVALTEVGLRGCLGVPCAQLSAGQQRRVLLARLKLSRASLWLLDEPATALDAAGVALLDTLLQEHCAGGGAAVVATHIRLASATKTLSLGSDGDA